MNPSTLALALLLWAPGTDQTATSTPHARIDPALARPPVAKKVPTTRVVLGERRLDDYDWLRDKTNPEVLSHLRAENDYTAAIMRPTQALQQELYREMLGRTHETDMAVPYRQGSYWYYTRTEQGEQYPILCRKRGIARRQRAGAPRPQPRWPWGGAT